MLVVGQVVRNRYRVDAPLGHGGMGAVYRAWDTRLDIWVAIKEMRPDPNADAHTLAQLRQQFKHEAQVVAGLDHPNLVRVTDYFSWDGSECLVMNFVQGESLAERIERQGAQSEAQALEWARQLLDALAYCHTRDVVHRDIKPQNVIITPEGRPVLVDFGLVKLWDPNDPRTRTAIQAMGTPEYAPPEQYGIAGRHTDPRSDLYSLGATLYHALTGRTPMSATDRMAMPEQFTPPRKLAPRVSVRTEAAVLKAMALPIANRFPSAQEMRDALREAPSLPPSPRGLPKWAWGLGGVALLLSLIVCLVVGVRIIQGLLDDVETSPPITEQSTAPPEPTATPRAVVVAITPTIGSPSQTPEVATPTPTPEPVPTASPSCSIVFDSNRDGHWEVYAMDESGLNLVNLSRHPAQDGDPSCSRDGRRIAFDTDRDGNWEIYAMAADGSDVTRLTNDPADDDSPAWSPDASQVAFNSNRDGDWEIYTVNVADLSVANRTNHLSDDELPAWSPDGQRIAFASDRTGDWDLWLMNADGSNPINLTRHPDEDSFPNWSPDGRWIAFHSYRDGNGEIYVVGVDGSGLTRLTYDPADDWGPAWSCDGQRLAFSSNRDGDYEIYAMDANGENVVQLTYNDARDTWPVWSPAGH